MRLYSLLVTFLCFFISTTALSQSGSIVRVTLPDTITYWKTENIIGFDLAESAFVNWSAGGVSSVSGLFKGTFKKIYNKENLRWHNELLVRYGINKQDGIEIRKTDDAFMFNSTFGYRRDTLSNWFHSAKLNFNTQFTNGYNYPSKVPISKPFSPAYSFLGVGAEYANKEKRINVYISPLTMKNTLVLDQRLANQGSFGVEKAVFDVDGNLVREGKNSKTELGFLVTNNYKAELFKNVVFENRLVLYSDYINKFGNVDVDWQMQFDFIVNQYIRANINVHTIYDDDIKAKDQVNGQQVIVGPKVQLKQSLGIGVVYKF